MMKTSKSHKKRRRTYNTDVQELNIFGETWRPEDDYLLINSIFITSNLAEVHKCVSFSKPYLESEIEQRWRSLLFDQLVSSTALEAIENLPSIIKSHLHKQLPFSNDADNLLTNISYEDVYSSGSDKYACFDDLLHEHPDVFHWASASQLYSQWNRLRSCNLTIDSSKNPLTMPPNDRSSKNRDIIGGDPSSFSDTEFLIRETVSRNLHTELQHSRDAAIVARRKRMLRLQDCRGFQAHVSQSVVDSLQSAESQESRIANFNASKNDYQNSQSLHRSTSIQLNCHSCMHSADGSFNMNPDEQLTEDYLLQRRKERYRLRRRIQARLQYVGEEARRWTALVESEVANSAMISDHEPIFPTLATLTGRQSKFLIKSRNVTFGRASISFSPDIDLSCEGSASRISRRHGEIYLADTGTFWLSNFSTHPVFVDGISVLKGREAELSDHSIVTVSLLSFRFDVEHEYLGWISGSKGMQLVDQDHLEHDGEVTADGDYVQSISKPRNERIYQ